MNHRTSKWIGAWMLVIGGCDPFPHEEDSGAQESSDSGAITATSGIADEGGSVSVTSWGDDGGDDTNATIGSTSYGTGESCSVSVGEGTVSATTYAGSESGEDDGHPSDDDGGSGSTGGSTPLESCGVELEFAELNNFYVCACEECSVQYDGLTPESADEFLDACACICDAIGCGVSITGGATSDGGEDGEGTASGTGGVGESGGEDDGGRDVTGGSEVSGKYEDG